MPDIHTPPSDIAIDYDDNVPMIPSIIFFGTDDINTADYYFAEKVPEQLSSPDQPSYYAMPNFRALIK